MPSSKTVLSSQQPSGDRDKRIIKISCEAKEAQNLLALAANVCPDAIPPIEKALASLGPGFRLKLPLPFRPRISTAGGNHGTSATALSNVQQITLRSYSLANHRTPECLFVSLRK